MCKCDFSACGRALDQFNLPSRFVQSEFLNSHHGGFQQYAVSLASVVAKVRSLVTSISIRDDHAPNRFPMAFPTTKLQPYLLYFPQHMWAYTIPFHTDLEFPHLAHQHKARFPNSPSSFSEAEAQWAKCVRIFESIWVAAHLFP